MDHLNFIKYKNLYSSEHIIKQLKKQSTDWEKILHFVYMTKDLYAECKQTPTNW